MESEPLATKRKSKMPNVKTLSIELLSAAAEGEPYKPPPEFRIFRAGMNESHKGVFKFSQASAERVLAKAREHGNDFAIDYDHGTFAFISADPAEAKKAAGWFKLDARDGELWATSVSWTPKATAMLSAREYRYISPAFDADNSGEVQQLLNVALTNFPALYKLEPLVASALNGAGQPEVDEESPEMNKAFLILLGLAENATESEVMATLQRLMAQQNELVQLTAKTSLSDAIAVVRAWKAAADAVPAMHQELSQLKERAENEKRDALISDGKKRGVVPPAYEPVLKTMTLSQLESFLAVAVPVHGDKKKEPVSDTTVTVALSTHERDIAKLMGVSEKDYAERKAARGRMITAGASAE